MSSSFSLQIESFITTELGANLDRVLQEVAFDAGENVIVGGKFAPGTPVDTGYARNGWVPSINGPIEGPSGTHEKPSGGAPADPTAILAAKAGDTIYWQNNVAYIEALEYGHSKQAPQGMVRLTVAAGQQLVDAAVARVTGGNA